jgi:sensor domain CHASE-containing protein
MSLLIAGSLLAALVMRMDRQASSQARQMMEGALQTRSSALATMTRDYGRWDDAVLNLYGKVNHEWAVANLSNATHVFVLDQSGATLFSVGPDGSEGVVAASAMRADLPTLLRKLPTAVEDARALESGVEVVASFNGSPALVSAMPIIPYSDRIAQPREPLRYIAITQALDQQLLKEWQKSYDLKRVRLSASKIADPEHSIPLQPGAERLGFLVWDPVEPGRAAARSLAPYLLLAFLTLGLTCFSLGRRVLAVTRALAQESAAAERAAGIAAANLEIARQAQVKAEAARQRAECLASKASCAQREAILQHVGQPGADEGLASGKEGLQ